MLHKGTIQDMVDVMLADAKITDPSAYRKSYRCLQPNLSIMINPFIKPFFDKREICEIKNNILVLWGTR